MIRRKTNRRHMTGDHHGQTAGMATLLARALDGLLGTHRSDDHRSPPKLHEIRDKFRSHQRAGVLSATLID